MRRLPPAHERRPLRMSDIVALSVGAALLVVVLAGLSLLAPKFQPPKPTAQEINAAIMQQNLRARAAHRQGSILIVDPESCTDYAFDNLTGNIGHRNEVDCDERLAQMKQNQAEQGAERMRSVIEGFRR